MADDLGRRFTRANELYLDLVRSLSAEQLASRLGDLPSNTIGEQLWCVVGARESYTRAASAGAWAGFSCSLASDRTTDAAEVLRLLESTHRDIVLATASVNELGRVFLVDLLEHESQHHGQLIRYLYAHGIDRPPSWRDRYALS